MSGLIDRFRGWNRRRVAALRRASAPRKTPFGFVMNGTDGMVSGRFEPEETALVRTLMTRCDRFVNIGANTGYYCLFARQAGLPVTAFEPVPGTANILMQNLLANGWAEGATVLPVAAGDTASAIRIYGVGTGASVLKGWANNPESLSQLVPMVRLDDVVRQPLGAERLLILMDVEGFEYPALCGAAALIAANPKPVWMIEIAPDGAGTAKSDHVQATFELMRSAGYAAMRADARLAPVTGPVSGVTNYIFHDADVSVDAIFGPVADRIRPFPA